MAAMPFETDSMPGGTAAINSQIPKNRYRLCYDTVSFITFAQNLNKISILNHSEIANGDFIMNDTDFLI